MTDLDRMTMNDEAAFYALHQDLKPYGKIIAEDGYLAGYEKGFDTATTKARVLLKQWLQTTYAGACDNVNLAAETEQFLAGDL